MAQSLRDIVGPFYAPVVIPTVRIITTLVLAYIVLRVIDSALKRLHLILPPSGVIGLARVEQRTETLRHMIRSVLKGVLLVFIALEVGSELGYNISGVWASVGIAGLAVGFGAQSLVKDVISGFFILFEDQYGVGDVVKIGDFSGVVEHMTLRSTVLRNLEGHVHVVPNGNIQNVTVMTKEWARAVLDLTIPHEEPIGRTFEVLERVGNRLAQDWPDRVLDRPTILGVEKIDDSGVNVRSIVKTPPFKNADVLREWRLRAIEEFDRAGLRFAQRAPVTPISNSAPAKKT